MKTPTPWPSHLASADALIERLHLARRLGPAGADALAHAIAELLAEQEYRERHTPNIDALATATISQWLAMYPLPSLPNGAFRTLHTLIVGALITALDGPAPTGHPEAGPASAG